MKKVEPTSVYLVEDEALIAMELADQLTSLGYSVCGQAARGEQALEEIPHRGPDVVLMDIQLSGALSGIETAERLRTRLDVPVVYLTAFSDDRLVDRAIHTGSFGYLTKPFEQRELHATIQAACYKHRVEQLLRNDKDRLEAIVQERSAALWESEAQLRDIFEGTSDLIQSADVDGRLLLVNRAWRETMGYSSDEVSKMGFLDVVVPEQRGMLAELFERLRKGEDVGLVDVNFRKKDGTHVIVEGRLSVRVAKGKIAGFRGIFRDVTARRAAEAETHALNQRLERLVLERTAALAETERRFRALFERSPIFIGLFSLPEGRVLELNPAALAALGRTREETIGRTTVDVGLWPNQDDRARFLAELDSAGQVSQFPTSFCRRNGDPFPVLVTATTFELDGQTCALASIQDITLRQRAERGLEQAHRRVIVLAQLGRELAEALTPRAAALSLLEAARQLLGWDSAWVRFWNEPARVFDCSVNFDIIDGERREIPPCVESLRDPSPIVRRTMAQGPQLHLREHDGDGIEGDRIFGAPRRSLSRMFVPIQRDGRLLGVISLQSYTRHAYDSTALQLLASLADHCSGALARLQIRADLDASEERFKLANRATFDVIWDQDIATGAVWWSEHFQATYGHDPVEAGKSGNFWRDCLHPEDRERVIERVNAVLASDSDLWSDHYRFRRKDGSYAHVEDRAHIVRDAAGAPVRLLGAMQDRTEQMTILEALRESEVRFRATFEASPIPLVVSTMPEGRIVEVNAAALAAFGYTREEVLGRTEAALGVWAQPAQREEYFSRMVSGRTEHAFEALMRSKTGAERVMLCTGTVLSLGGRPCSLTSVVDITALRAAESEKAKLQERVFQNQKYEALGTLAGGVAHDFNNILTGILNYTTLAKSDCPPGHPEVEEFLEEVLNCGNRAKELVKQILLFSRSESAERGPLYLQHVVKEALSLLRSTLPAGVEIVADLERQAPIVVANATQIHQVVMNLAINASQAMPAAGGTLTIRLQARHVDAALAEELPDLKPGRHVCLEVSDTGSGMEPAVVARIFEPFFTTKKAGEGTGLGLAVVHSVVRSQRGAIRVRSQLGMGSTFELFFPVQQTASEGGRAAARGLRLGNGQHILVVDDEALVIKSLQLVLERLGYRATTFSHPEQALARFSAGPEEFDALITDIQMPSMSGVELAQKILALRPTLPVFVMSGFAGTLTERGLLSEGIAGVLAKPFEMTELSETLATRFATGATVVSAPRDA